MRKRLDHVVERYQNSQLQHEDTEAECRAARSHSNRLTSKHMLGGAAYKPDSIAKITTSLQGENARAIIARLAVPTVETFIRIVCSIERHDVVIRAHR